MALAIAVVGVAIGLLPLLFGFVGDTHALYGTQSEIDDYENRINGSNDATQERFNAQQQQNTVRFIVGGTGADFGTYWPGYVQILAIVISGIVGAIAAVSLSGDTREVFLTAAGGALVGAVLFVVLATFLATLGWETATPSTMEGMQADDQKPKVSIRYTGLLLNSLVIGVLSAVASGGSAFFADLLGE